MLHGRGYHVEVQIEVRDSVDAGWFVAVGIPAERKVIEGHLGGSAIATGQSQIVHSAEKGGVAGRLVSAVSVRTMQISVGLPLASAVTKLRAVPVPTVTVGP